MDACSFARLQLSGRARINKKVLQLLNPEYYNAQKYISLCKKTTNRVKIMSSFECFGFLFEPNLTCEPMQPITVECGEGLAIFPAGDVYLCVLLRDFKAGNVRDKELKAIWVGSEIFNFFRNFSILESCKECDYLPICRCGCRGNAFLETGQIESIDPLCPILNGK